MDGITWIYRALTIPALMLALWRIFKGFLKFKHQTYETQIMLFVLIGMLAMALFRTFIIAFMEVAAFDIGTYAMYLGAVYPVVVLVCVLALSMLSSVRNFKVILK